MGWSRIPYFDDEVTPKLRKEFKDLPSYCRECNHKDCEEIREMRKTKCVRCFQPFEAGDAFYDVGTERKDNQFAHAGCEEEYYEKQRK